jgi:hypothetical protein
LAGFAVIGIAGGAALLTADRSVKAADHLDPPARTDPAVDQTPDKAADIADIFAWYDSTFFNIAMTFAGPSAASLPPTFDRDVLYTLNINNDGSKISPNYAILIRFAQDSGGNWGVQFTGVPGSSGPIAGPVDTDLKQGSVTVRGGLFDDPFFFDLQGFKTTKSTGKLSIINSRNFFAGQNDTAVVLQFPRSAVENGTNPVRIWGTTARFGGQI